MTTWLLRLDTTGEGPRLAVKDCIDMAGLPTTVGCPVIAERGGTAMADAPVVSTARAAGARIVGKTNLTELCWSADGINEWSGTPVNPLDSARVPGGSSSGSAVAVATGEADTAYGTDTGGSVRIPAACCGIAGLKTSWGRIPREGVYPLAPSLDTVGPLGRTVAAVELGMRLLEPGFTVSAYDAPMTIGRLRPLNPVKEIWPQIDLAIDGALAAAGFATEDVTGVDFKDSIEATGTLIDREGYLANVHLLPDLAKLREHNRDNMASGADLDDADIADARAQQDAFQAQLATWLRRYPLLALPTIATPPPLLDDPRMRLTALTAPINLSGLPALALPTSISYPDTNIPVSLQLVGPHGSEELLIAAGYLIEQATAGG